VPARSYSFAGTFKPATAKPSLIYHYQQLMTREEIAGQKQQIATSPTLLGHGWLKADLALI